MLLSFLLSLGQKRKPYELKMHDIQKYIYKRSNEQMRPFECAAPANEQILGYGSFITIQLMK